ncbi:MAG: hypothetical protein AAGA23_05335 [Pseudomonadota bacterium]
MKERNWTQALGEFTVIFVSIVLALLADDWRENRSEQEDGLDALELILADLESEASGFGRFRERLGQQAQAAANLLRLIEEGGSAEAIAGGHRGVVLYYNFEVGAAAYRGLAGSGGLRLIGNDAVVAALASYYDGSIAYMDGLRLGMERDADAVAVAGQRHFLRIPTYDDDGLLKLNGWAFQLESTSTELQTDRAFLAAVGAAGSSASWLALRIDDVYLKRSAETRQVVGHYLEQMGRAQAPATQP